MACAFAPPPQSPRTIVNAIMAAQDRPPHGRPPVGCVWEDGRWLHVENGERYSAARQHIKHLEKRKVYEQRRYWDPRTRVRVHRLERSARAGGTPFKSKPLQLELSDPSLASACVTIAGVSVARDVNLTDD